MKAPGNAKFRNYLRTSAGGAAASRAGNPVELALASVQERRRVYEAFVFGVGQANQLVM